MACVHKLRNIDFCVHPRGEHPPPHVHVYGPDWTLVVEIRSGQTRKGRAPPALVKEIKTWISENADFLLKKWDELNERDG